MSSIDVGEVSVMKQSAAFEKRDAAVKGSDTAKPKPEKATNELFGFRRRTSEILSTTVGAFRSASVKIPAHHGADDSKPGNFRITLRKRPRLTCPDECWVTSRKLSF